MNLSTGHFYVKMGKIDEAIRKFKDALDIKPDFNIENFIAYAYAMKEDYAETFKWTDEFIENTPSEGKKADGYILKGFYHYWLGCRAIEQNVAKLINFTTFSKPLFIIISLQAEIE